MITKGQPKYLERDGLRDSVVEIFYINPIYRVEHLVKTILNSGDMEDFHTIPEKGCVYLQNNIYRIQVLEDRISFNNIKDYQGWQNYGPFIQKIVRKVLSLPEIMVERQMIRYISMYPEVSIFDKLNGKRMELYSFPQLNGTEIRFKMGVTDNARHLGIATVSLTDNLPSSKSDVKISVVDIQIETHTDNNLQNETLEFLHTQERNLFFSLLSKEFVNSLGAHY